VLHELLAAGGLSGVSLKFPPESPLQAHPALRAAKTDLPPAAWLDIPLEYAAVTLGILTIEFPELETISTEDTHVAHVLAELLAAWLARISRAEQLQNRAARLEEQLRESENTGQMALQELEAFLYSVTHDLRAPLRGIDGYSKAIQEDFGDSLSEMARAYLEYIREASRIMASQIDQLLYLSRVMRAELHPAQVNLSMLAENIAEKLQQDQPERRVTFMITPGMTLQADAPMMELLLQNLIGNAWKFTSQHPAACIEFGFQQVEENHPIYFVHDDGAGFNMAYANKLFKPFQRLHGSHEFEGVGIGLAIVERIIRRHYGRVWLDSAIEQGTTVFFTLQENGSQITKTNTE
jgi:light-regulated signal transduction histidine kinase (bacteriophytochrome)